MEQRGEGTIRNKNQYLCGYLWEQGGRQSNQDSLAIWQISGRSRTCLLGIVCDGIGGLEEGENASGYVVRQVSSWFHTVGYKIRNRQKLQAVLCQLIYQLHEELKEYGEKKGIRLGTTMTFFLAENRWIFWGHTGDSRLYMLRKGKLKQLTRDHTKKGGGLYQAIGTGDWKPMDMGRKSFKPGDGLLLCTDGFYRGLSGEDLSVCLNQEFFQESQIGRVLHQMGQRKLGMGEKDNLSAIICKFIGKER
ncbi:MAG: PP2C family protein-serine/threonine phosphatase [Lachnospiraceae bacterium]